MSATSVIGTLMRAALSTLLPEQRGEDDGRRSGPAHSRLGTALSPASAIAAAVITPRRIERGRWVFISLIACGQANRLRSRGPHARRGHAWRRGLSSDQGG